MTLAEFLLARIAEDEAVARAGWTTWDGTSLALPNWFGPECHSRT